MTPDDFEHPDLVPEYVQSLQDQADALRSANQHLRSRVLRLEKEREELRSRATTLRRRFGRKTSRFERPKKTPDNSIDIPDVGRIGDLRLPPPASTRADLTVATILDEFSRTAFQYEVNLVEIEREGWEATLEAKVPDVLLVESAYGGFKGSWAGQIARFGRPSDHLAGLVEWCKARGIPTVFWVKEDPINHDWFLASASLFDVVFTVDSNCIDSYRRRLGHDRVGVLQFAAQPAIHHPPQNDSRVDRVAFAGSYYASKHPARRVQMEQLLGPALEFGLHIFDRMDKQTDPRFAWPPEYLSHVIGSLSYPQTLEAYRRYAAFINVNTVTDSPTMCARRVYELLASGTRVISGPSRALSGVPVEIAGSSEETRALLGRAAAHSSEERQAWVHQGNLVRDRVESILGAL